MFLLVFDVFMKNSRKNENYASFVDKRIKFNALKSGKIGAWFFLAPVSIFRKKKKKRSQHLCFSINFAVAMRRTAVSRA